MNNEAAPLPETAYGQQDWLLQTLVDIVNATQVRIGITLQTGGMLVSGMLVSGKDFFEGFAANFASGFPSHDEGVENIKQRFVDFGDIYAPQEGETPMEYPPHFVHLANARFFGAADNPIPGRPGVWWRGRLSEVSGFLLGTLEEENR